MAPTAANNAGSSTPDRLTPRPSPLVGRARFALPATAAHNAITDPTDLNDYSQGDGSAGDGSSHAYTSSIKSGYDEGEEEEELLCGYWSCTPSWLQRFHTAKCLLAMLGMCAFIQSFVVNAIFPVDLSTLEKRFHMTSTQTGVISSWYDFAVLLAVGPVCHWGNTTHKGRWIGLGAIVMALGSFICALPHYLTDPYRVGSQLTANASDLGQCSADRLSGTLSVAAMEQCSANDEFNSSWRNPYFLIFLLGQTFHGIGSTPLFSIGTAYLDENVSQKASPVYLAIYAVITSIGPVIGLFAGGFFLSIYVDVDRVEMSSVPMHDSSDPRWVGAWWIGFLGCGVAALITAFPVLMFAKELPEAKHQRCKDVNQVHARCNIDDSDEILKGDVKHLPKAIWNILINPTFVTCIVLGIFESMIINGFSAFMPKILETILSTTPTKASYMSSVVIFAAAAGVMVGGMVIRQLNLQVGGMLKMIFVCQCVALLLITSFLIQCPAREFVGINVGYHEHKHLKNLSLDAQCNDDCHCSSEWNPVCDPSSGQTYYSACFAGCALRKVDANGHDLWEGCSCAPSSNNNTREVAPSGSEGDTLRSGFCTKECGWPMWIFLALLFFSVVASFASSIPLQQIMLRVVPFKQRTLAIGVNWYFLRLLGFIPGGVLFGLMIDTTCLKWQNSACGKRQSCLVHDPGRLSWTIMAVAIVCKLVSILATIIGYTTYRPNDSDASMSVQTTDSRGPLSLTVNDDRSKMKMSVTPTPTPAVLENRNGKENGSSDSAFGSFSAPPTIGFNGHISEGELRRAV